MTISVKPHIIIKLLTIASLTMLFLTLLLSSCKKEDTTEFVKAAEVASEHTNADLDATCIFAVLHKIIYDTALINNNTAIIDSATVFRVFDTLIGITNYTIDYGDGIVAPDFKHKSGIIEAVLDKNFQLDSATIQANFSNYMVNEINLNGTASYTNTGDFSTGTQKFIFLSEISFSNNHQTIIQYSGNKEIYWTQGFLKPEKLTEQYFTINGNSTGLYTNSSNIDIPEASIFMEITTGWSVSFSCNKLVKQGAINIQETFKNTDEIITGDFMDSDLDGCSDKIMLKNNSNFGYPFYI